MISLIALMCSGCAGTGFNKRTELMPDEVSLAIDARPHEAGRPEDWYVGEVSGGAKWKLN